jgi:hypothetical protein
MVNGGAQAANTRVAKVVRVEHGRVVHLVVGDAFDVPRTAECRVDCHGVATRRAARIGESEGLVIVRSRETTARAGLAAAGARASVPANAIGLRRITRCELAWWDLLIWTAGTGRDGVLDRLHSTRVGEVE